MYRGINLSGGSLRRDYTMVSTDTMVSVNGVGRRAAHAELPAVTCVGSRVAQGVAGAPTGMLAQARQAFGTDGRRIYAARRERLPLQ
jgi:hypothetical protein